LLALHLLGCFDQQMERQGMLIFHKPRYSTFYPYLFTCLLERYRLMDLRMMRNSIFRLEIWKIQKGIEVF
jgi:hypothetical protein